MAVTAPDQNQMPLSRWVGGGCQCADERSDDSLVRVVVLDRVVVDLEVIQVAAHFALFDT